MVNEFSVIQIYSGSLRHITPEYTDSATILVQINQVTDLVGVYLSVRDNFTQRPDNYFMRDSRIQIKWIIFDRNAASALHCRLI